LTTPEWGPACSAAIRSAFSGSPVGTPPCSHATVRGNYVSGDRHVVPASGAVRTSSR
jgi:hypothetical protein